MTMDRPRPHGSLESDILEFITLIEKAEETGGTASASGDISGPFFSRTAYGCVVRVGLRGNGHRPKRRSLKKKI